MGEIQTIVRANRRVIEEKNKLRRENESLKIENKCLMKEKIGKRLLRVGLEMEKESALTRYKWKRFDRPPLGDYFNCVATSQHKVIAGRWGSTLLWVIDIHSSDVTWSTVDNTQNPYGDRVMSLFNAGDECFGTFYNKGKQQRIGIYREDRKQWHHVTDIPPRDQLCFYGITGDRHHVYILGGGDYDHNIHDTILIYDINTGTQCYSKKMSSKRWGYSCTIIGNMLYIGGGGDRVRGLNSIECISLSDYSSHHTMPATPTYGCSLTSLGDRLVMVGGTVNGSSSHSSNMVSVLSPSLNSWLPLPAMNEERFAHGRCTVGDDTLVVVGGMKCIDEKFANISSCEIL